MSNRFAVLHALRRHDRAAAPALSDDSRAGDLLRGRAGSPQRLACFWRPNAQTSRLECHWKLASAGGIAAG